LVLVHKTFKQTECQVLTGMEAQSAHDEVHALDVAALGVLSFICSEHIEKLLISLISLLKVLLKRKGPCDIVKNCHVELTVAGFLEGQIVQNSVGVSLVELIYRLHPL